MEILYVFSVILGSCLVQQGQAQQGSTLLTCIQCVHISATNVTRFSNSDYMYQMLAKRFNPACTTENPLDSSFNPSAGQPNNPQSATGIAETICQSFSQDNKCIYIYGQVQASFPVYSVTIPLFMAIRDCMASPGVLNTCYQRDTSLGYAGVRTKLEEHLQYVSHGAKVERFIGRQCYCNTNKCAPIISSADRTSGYVSGVLLAIVTFLLIT